MRLHPPVRVALARNESTIPPGEQWSVEPKFDGWRALVFRDETGVALQARSGRLVTDRFPELVTAALRLPPGCVVDGEVVVWHEGRVDFRAVQHRALSAPVRARHLAEVAPASFAAFDLLEADGEDWRPRPYRERRERLVELVGVLGPPIQPVPATSDRDVALDWWERWRPSTNGVEGLMVKHTGGAYRGGVREWRKIRHWESR